MKNVKPISTCFLSTERFTTFSPSKALETFLVVDFFFFALLPGKLQSKINVIMPRIYSQEFHISLPYKIVEISLDNYYFIVLPFYYIYPMGIIFNYQRTFRPCFTCRNYYNVMTILKNVLQAASKRFIILHVQTMTIKTSLYSNIIKAR